MKPVIYQLVLRLFSNLETAPTFDGTIEVNGCGRFADLTPAALRGLRELGATHLWLTGMPRQATLTEHPGLPADPVDIVKGRAGSFYAVKDWFDVCPDYASDPAQRIAEFRALVERIHDAGLKVLVDFVPNHVSRAYATGDPSDDFATGDDRSQFFSPANGYFYLVDPPGQELALPRPGAWVPGGTAFSGTFAGEGRPPRASGDNVTSAQPPATAWYETVKLTYGWNFATRTGHYQPQPKTWAIVDRILAFWQGLGVDGFRCDFAHYVPPEAWRFLISRARGRDSTAVFVAEAYPWVGSGDPVERPEQLIEAGFTAVYHAPSYEALKHRYRGEGSEADYGQALDPGHGLGPRQRLMYLENHDECRVASPIRQGCWAGDSGFGSAAANYQLLPLQALAGPGPVLVLNGQEVGETGAGATGFKGDNGRSTIFDYGTLPALQGWVNRHRYDGGGLTAEQRALRTFTARVLALCQDDAVRVDGFHRLDGGPGCEAFARFRSGSGRLLLVAAEFRIGGGIERHLRLPASLLVDAGLDEAPAIRVRCLLHRPGSPAPDIAPCTPVELMESGLTLVLGDQEAVVLELIGA